MEFSNPQDQTNFNFTALKWMQEFASTFKGQVTIPKGQDSSEVCNMKSKKVQSTFYDQLEVAMAKSTDYANKHHKSNNDASGELVMS